MAVGLPGCISFLNLLSWLDRHKRLDKVSTMLPCRCFVKLICTKAWSTANTMAMVTENGYSDHPALPAHCMPSDSCTNQSLSGKLASGGEVEFPLHLLAQHCAHWHAPLKSHAQSCFQAQPSTEHSLLPTDLARLVTAAVCAAAIRIVLNSWQSSTTRQA